MKILEEGLIALDQSSESETIADKYSRKYAAIRAYVLGEENRDLLQLRQMFDEQREVVFGDDLAREGQPGLSWELMSYNNFGICAQQVIRVGKSTGKAHLKASFTIYDKMNGPSRMLESELAEIAVYNPLVSVKPVQSEFVRDLYSVSQNGQEFQSFDGFYDQQVLNMQYGTSLKWKFEGGTNFWHDYMGNYITDWNVQPTDGDDINVIQVEKIKERTGSFSFALSCHAPTDLQQLKST